MRIKKLISKNKRMEKLAIEKVSGQFSLTEKMALKVVRVGTDKVNFKILKMLSSNINVMSKEFNLTKVPINVRVNELEKVGLVLRFRGTGNVALTDFGKFFIDKIEEYEEIVCKRVTDIVERHFE